jgi:hypothetical protein
VLIEKYPSALLFMYIHMLHPAQPLPLNCFAMRLIHGLGRTIKVASRSWGTKCKKVGLVAQYNYNVITTKMHPYL